MIAQSVWDKRATLYDVCAGSRLRRGHHKDALFGEMRGRVLFVAIGTGLDIRHLPLGPTIVAVDVSAGMISKAAARATRYPGQLCLVQADAMKLCFADHAFDTIATSCTMCSVPDPAIAFRELYRVLRPGGRLLMLEHMRSGNTILGLVLDMMTVATRRSGTEMNRRTIANALSAGFHITSVASVYLDIVLRVRAVKPVA